MDILLNHEIEYIRQRSVPVFVVDKEGNKYFFSTTKPNVKIERRVEGYRPGELVDPDSRKQVRGSGEWPPDPQAKLIWYCS